MRNLFALFVALPTIMVGSVAYAQTAPSADQIVTSLRPTGNIVAGATRGIRLSGTHTPTPNPQGNAAPAAPIIPVVPTTATAQ